MTRPSRGYLAWSLLMALAAPSVAACSDDGAAPGDGPPTGYVRYEPPDVTVGPGESRTWVQWVAAPFDHDQNVVDLIGTQGVGGHHALLYTSKEIQPIGTTREFLNEDQADIQLIGGVGGEGGKSVKLPAGVVMRVPAGRALLMQTHYFNGGDMPIQGHSKVDVKFAELSPDDKVASFFVSTVHQLELPAHADFEREVSCLLKKDLPMLMVANHMHEIGVSVQTTITAPGGVPEMVKDDPAWNPEWTFNPEYRNATVEAPLMLKAGSTVTTHCSWHNATDKVVGMPNEMCVFFGFFLGEKDVTCVEGNWYE